MTRLSSTLVLVALASCGVDVALPPGLVISCTSDAECPSGLVCAGTCVAELDTDPPGLANVSAPADGRIRLVFDEPMADALEAATFAITPALEVYGATFAGDDAAVIVLATPELEADTTYQIAISGLTDVAGNALDPDPTIGTLEIGATPIDTSPPALLSPDDEEVVALSVALVWEARLGATSYTVDVSRDASFATLFGTYEVAAPGTALTVELDDARRFYWRVKSNLSVTTPSRVMEAVGSTVHVYCSATDATNCADLRRQTGSKDFPFVSPSRGVFAALASGAHEVRIAARGGTAAYADALFITSAVDISGGYDATFSDASYDPTAHRTILTTGIDALYLYRVVGPMRVRGLELVTTEETNNVVFVAGCQGVHLDHIKARGHGVLLVQDNGGAPTLITNSRFEGSNASPTAARLYGGIVRDSELIAPVTAAHPGDGIQLRDGAVVEQSKVSVGVLAAATGLPVVGARVWDRSVLRNNVIVSKMELDSTVLVVEAGTVVGNTILGAAKTYTGNGPPRGKPAVITLPDAAAGGNTTGATITNNIIASLLPDRHCVSDGAYADPLSFQNNVLVGCANKAYADWNAYGNSGSIDLEPNVRITSAQVNGLDNQLMNNNVCDCQHGRYSGNIVSSLALDQVFVDFDGPDNDAWTIADNDLHLLLTADPENIATGAKDATGADCGTHEAPISCGGDDLDVTGAARTVPWSIGAYEK